jgi:hypothetical protein
LSGDDGRAKGAARRHDQARLITIESPQSLARRAPKAQAAAFASRATA